MGEKRNIIMPEILTLTMNPSVDKSSEAHKVVPERKLRCDVPRFEPGGGGINVARAIHKLGGKAEALYPEGGPMGKVLADLLDREEIPHQSIPIEGWTRESMTVTETSTEQQFRFTMPGPALKDHEWKACIDALKGAEPQPDYVVLSGSLPRGIPENFVDAAVDVARELGAKVLLDTSGAALPEKGVFLVKPNLRELQQITHQEFRNELQQQQAAEKLVASGKAEAVVISLGRAGAHLVWKDGCNHLRAPSVPIKSKVGAGDSMVAGIVLGLARGKALLDAVRFGVAAGTAAVMTPGSGLCRREDTERLYQSMISEASS
jgi:6-phosphofructokinase 2